MRRREFLTGTVAALAAMRATAKPLGLAIGCQTYPVRDAIGKDFDGTLKTLAGAGFETIEMCSPPGYATSGFGALIAVKPADLRQRIAAAGLACESCHYGFSELQQSLDARLDYARELGLKQMVLSSFGISDKAPLDDWMRAAERLNDIGERTAQAGIQLAYHNHNGEFARIDDALIYDALLRVLDRKMVKMQFQTSVVSLGFEAAPYFRKYPGRFVSIHVSDWSKAEKKAVPVGKGDIDWKALFAAAKAGGVKNYFVEMNLDLMVPSLPYLRALAD